MSLSLGVAQTVSIVDVDPVVRWDVLHGFHQGLVGHPRYGADGPLRLPTGSLTAPTTTPPSPGDRRMVWLGLRASPEPIAEAVQLAEQLDALGEQTGADAWSALTGFGEFRPAVEWRGFHGAGDSAAQAFAFLGGAGGRSATDVAAAVRVLHTQLTGVPLLPDGGALGLDGPGLRARALMAAAWVRRVADELPVALAIDGAHAVGPFLVELVRQLHETSAAVLIVLAGAADHSAPSASDSLAGPFSALRPTAVPARVLPRGDAGAVGALLARASADLLFLRADVDVCRHALGTSSSVDEVLDELASSGWTCRVSNGVFSFTSAHAHQRAREQAAGRILPATIEAAQRALMSQIGRATGESSLAHLLATPSTGSWERARALAQWGELERAVAAAAVPSAGVHASARAAWSSLAAGRTPSEAPPLEVLPADAPDGATSAVLAGLVLAARRAPDAGTLLRDGLDRLGPPREDPHDEAHNVRVAAARGLLVVGDLDGADRAVAGLRNWLPEAAAGQLDQFGEWRALPGVCARSIATIENLHAISVLRAWVPGSPALGHLLLARLELLEQIGRLGTADDAAFVAAEAIDTFRCGSANRDELWRARRWSAWVALRRGDSGAATTDLRELLDETIDVVGADDPRSLTTSEWLARGELEAGLIDDALQRLDAVVAARTRISAPAGPDLLSAQHWFGVSLARANRHDEAVAWLSEVVRGGGCAAGRRRGSAGEPSGTRGRPGEHRSAR